MKSKNALLLAAVSAFALIVTTTTANAAYRCSWTDGIKLCGNELGFAPSAGSEADRRDQHSGDHESGAESGSDGGDTGDTGDTGDSGDSGDSSDGGSDGGSSSNDTGNGGRKGNNGIGNGGGDGSPNGRDDGNR